MPRGVRLDYEEAWKAAALYRGGKSINQVGHEMGLGEYSVRRYLRHEGVSIRQGTGNRFARKPAPDLFHITPTQWAYLAGIIDGEGCLAMAHVQRAKGADNYHVNLTITQRDPTIIDWIDETFPQVGHTKQWTRKDSTTRKRWTVSSAETVIVVLKGVLPYLTLKRSQAQWAVRLVSYPRPNRIEQRKIAKRISTLKRSGMLK